MKHSLICGVSGQDGAYLARILVEKGHRVFGTSRELKVNTLSSLRDLGISKEVTMYTMDIRDVASVSAVLKDTKADEVYNLAAQSSVGMSFSVPFETIEGIVMGTTALLEASRKLSSPPRLVFAGSGDTFGPMDKAATEVTPLSPQSPYAAAKAASSYIVSAYASAYGLHASTAFLFNHESPLRDGRFFSKKVAAAVARIARGSKERLVLGDLTLERDFGWAPEYMEALPLMLEQSAPASFVIATGKSMPLAAFVEAAFAEAGLDYRSFVDFDPSLVRAGDSPLSAADPTAAFDVLGWRSTQAMTDVARLMVQAELSKSEHLP